jgi:hypothetical protein
MAKTGSVRAPASTVSARSSDRTQPENLEPGHLDRFRDQRHGRGVVRHRDVDELATRSGHEITATETRTVGEFQRERSRSLVLRQEGTDLAPSRVIDFSLSASVCFLPRYYLVVDFTEEDVGGTGNPDLHAIERTTYCSNV